MYAPNFELLYSDGSWRTSWTHIVPGRFSSSPYAGLLFFEQATGYAEVYETDGQGRIVAPPLQTYEPLGDRAQWTHVIPGLFGSSGLTGLLLYDRATGFARFFECEGDGVFTQLSEYSDWRDTWTHIVPGLFTMSPTSALLFYSPSEGYGELWRTDRVGLAGTAPVQTFTDWRSSWTHIVAADFFWTPGFIGSTPVFSDVFFYEALTGYGEMYRFDSVDIDPTTKDGRLVPYPTASGTLVAGATNVIAGNFGFGFSGLLLHNRAAGELKIYGFRDTSHYQDPNDPTTLVSSADLVERETLSGLRTTFDLVVPGNFYMANPEDHWFNDGPTAFPIGLPYNRNWRAGTGAFTDVLLYDQAAGIGETYLHEPIPPPDVPLEAYISSQSSHSGEAPVASGSVLPGETISFRVSSLTPYTIKIYRQGYFAGGQTEQLMTQVGGLLPATGSLPIGRNAYKDGAGWPVAIVINTSNYPSGLYLARVQDTSSPPNIVDVSLVVRAPSDSETKMLLVIADTNYAAYNDWGGRNVYGYATADDDKRTSRAFVGTFPSSSALRAPYAFEVSFERPIGYTLGNFTQVWEVPMIQWLMRRGIPVDVCTARDLHFQAPTWPGYRLLLFVGHHEYWTWEMRDHVENFVKTGGNVAFFCANTSWWQVRISPGGDKLICYKIAGFDPALSVQPERTTVNWWDTPVYRPETDLTGASYYDCNFNLPDKMQYVVKNAAHWALQATGLSDGDRFGLFGDIDNLQSIIGPECDLHQPSGGSPMQSPADYTIASARDPRDNKETAAMGSFAKGSGEVFNAATMNWALALADDHELWNKIPRITQNVIDRLGPPRWTSVSEGKSTPGAPITAIVTGTNQVTLFLADPEGGVYTTSGNATDGWAPWSSVSEGRSRPGAPITAVVAGPNRVTLFLADPQGGVYTTSGNATGGWAPWSSVSEGQSTPGGAITAVVSGANRVSLFLADPQGGVYTTSGNATDGWAPWSSVSEGQSTPGGPITAVVTGPNRVTLFLADPQGGVYTTSGNATDGWAPWTSVSEGRSTPGGPITAVVTGPNRVTLFLADPQGGVYTTSGNATEGWQPWSGVSEGHSIPGAPITAVLADQNRVTLFLANPEGGVYTATAAQLS
jgi:hypothetical protein